MKILITGGHLTPALAVIHNLPKDVQVVYVGRKHALEGDIALSLEYQTILKKHISFIEFHPGRLQRRFIRHSVTSALRVPSGIFGAFKILRKEKPDVVLSFGGYVALPFALISKLLKIPLVTHEQTFGAGVTNKIIARFASFVCISWKTSEKYFPIKKTILTGNPVILNQPSEKFFNLLKTFDKKYPLLVITGGSLGSHTINVIVEQALSQLLKKYSIYHQTGDAQEFKDYERLDNLRLTMSEDLKKRYKVTKFIQPEDITAAYTKADLVISRSGANTVQLLLLLNKPSLLIPLLVGQKNEQKTNADFLVHCGLGEEISQNLLTPEAFITKIEKMLQNFSSYTNTKLQEQKALHEKAADRIIECIYVAYRQNKA